MWKALLRIVSNSTQERTTREDGMLLILLKRTVTLILIQTQLFEVSEQLRFSLSLRMAVVLSGRIMVPMLSVASWLQYRFLSALA